MSVRSLLLLIVVVPLLILGGASLLGAKIPLPEWGRDYVLRFMLNPEDEPL